MSVKHSVNELALFGGAPLFAEPLHVGRPNLPNRERLEQRLRECLDRCWLTNDGPLLKEFETRVAAQLGVRHCVAMANGTTALEIASRALGLTGEVILPAFTFVATAHALQWQQIRPVFCDVERQTHLLDPARVEELITPRTSGIVGVHLWGNGCDIERLSDIARRHQLKLMFDASHAFGCTQDGKSIGGFGDVEVFSFHATKFVHTLEGGAATTNCDELAERMRLMRNFGFETYDVVSSVGINGKMNEFEAAMGLGCLEEMPAFCEINASNFALWRAELSGIEGLSMVTPRAGESNNRQYVVWEVCPEASSLTRDELARLLWAENVRVRRYFTPGCHRMEPYRTLDPEGSRRLPVTEELCDRVLLFPTGTAVSEKEIRQVGELVRGLMANGAEIRARMSHVS